MKIVEVGPKDGLQNETVPIPTNTKVAFVDALSATGVGEIEVSAFVGKIQPEAVIGVVEKLIDIGINEVSISDTIGKASPDEVKRLLDPLLPKVSGDRIAVHFHDTYGRGVENVLDSRSCGITIFDSSVGALGGCPFAPGATGNVATEAVVKALEDKGVKVGVDLQKLSQARCLLDPFLTEDKRSLPKDGSPACAACQFSKGQVCCQR